MLARKARITLIAVTIVVAIIVIIGIFMFLYLKTDVFKSNEDMFFKYLATGFDSIDIIKNDDKLGIENTLSTSKYTSELKGKLEYTTNVGTDNEDKNSGINKIGLDVKSDIDKSENYKYQNISLATDTDTLVGIEYLKSGNDYGVRLKDVQQFVSSSDEQEKTLSDLGVQDISVITKDIDVNSILNFSDQEKQTLINTYSNVIKNNVSKDKYGKQTNTLITMNNGDLQTNSYYITLPVEEYNNLLVKILQEVEKDEIILSRLDKIQDCIKTKYSEYNPTQSLRDKFVSEVDSKIQDIQNNNIGSETVKIAIYESKGKAVRISAEKSDEKIIFDTHDNKIKINITNLSTDTLEKNIEIEKNDTDSQNELKFEYESKKNDSILKNIEIDVIESLNSDKINRNLKLTLQNKTYQGTLTLDENINTMDSFENQVTFENDNIKFSSLQDDQKNNILEILKASVQSQLDNLHSIASEDEYRSMLQNLGLIKTSIQISEDGGVTETERNRFNSQFEFFKSDNLTKDNIKELIGVVASNLQDVKVTLTSGETADLDINKLKDSSSDTSDYKKSISEILLYIKPNATSDEKQNNILEYVDKYSDVNKYSATIEYDNNGLVRLIRVKLQEDQEDD